MHTCIRRRTRLGVFLVVLSLVLPAPLDAQQDRLAERELFRNCWREGVVLQQRACIAHIYLQRVEAILEIARAPEVKTNGLNERTLQVLLTDKIYRQRQLAMRYREACHDLRVATKGGDSVAQSSTDIICQAFENQESADSVQVAALIKDIEPTGSTLVDRANANANAASLGTSASRVMFLSAAAMTYMLLDEVGLGMSKRERQALIAQSYRIYRGGKAQKPRFVLEQAVEEIRKFLTDAYKDRGNQ